MLLSAASVVGEMLAAQYGLGFMLARASGTIDTTGIFMVLIPREKIGLGMVTGQLIGFGRLVAALNLENPQQPASS